MIKNRVRVIIVLAAAALAAVLPASQAQAVGNFPVSSIADRAEVFGDGSFGGQCKAFVRDRVSEASGGTVVPYGYQQGFANAGGAEIPSAQAVRGDVIQVTPAGSTDATAESMYNPANTHTKLHTAIIRQNLGSGNFAVIDSNWNNNQLVLRHNLNPYTWASGSIIKIWRLGNASLATTTPVIAAGRNTDGRQEIFTVGGDNAIWHRWQNAPNAGWSAEFSLAGTAKSIAVGSNADGRLELFYIGADNAVWHRWQTSPGGGWSGEASFGGTAKSITVGRNADGRLEIFTVGGDNAIWHRWQNAPNADWSAEFSMGGYAKSLSAGSNADGRIELFYAGADNAVWHRWQTAPNGGWSTDASFGGWVNI